MKLTQLGLRAREEGDMIDADDAEGGARNASAAGG